MIGPRYVNSILVVVGRNRTIVFSESINPLMRQVVTKCLKFDKIKPSRFGP